MSSKKRVGQGTGSAGGQSCFTTTEEEQPQDPELKSSLGGLELKRRRMTSLDERSLADDEGLLGSCDQPGSGYSSSGDISVVLSRVGAVPSPGQQMSSESCEENKGSEIQAVGSCLKVIIQQKSESRAFRQTDEQTDRLTDTQTGGYYCHVCHSSCPSLQAFQCHMSGQEHQKRLAKITDLNNTTHSLNSRGRRPAMQRWCDTCQSHFTGNVVIHRQTKQHKLCKQSSRPFCSVCQRHFRTPRKFVEHMKSPEHKQQILQEEPLEEELITVDAVGCFKEEEEENRRQDEEDGKMKETAEREETEDVHNNDPDSSYGSSFVVPVSGFLCRLCNKFFHNETTARHMHCHTHTTSTCSTTNHKGQTHTPVDNTHTDKHTQMHVHTPKHRHKQRK